MQIELNSRFHPATTEFGAPGRTTSITPPIDADYFIARVPLVMDQAIVIFPKFLTIGCGFAQEEDWNTNLPITVKAEKIFEHIKHNKKYAEITDEQCIEAIRMLQRWWEEASTIARGANDAG